MGKISRELRETIAANIRNCRAKKFPGRGGGKQCAEAFGATPQQWSQWERGRRMPDKTRLEKIAAFFDVTMEWMRQDNTPPPEPAEANPPPQQESGPFTGSEQKRFETPSPFPFMADMYGPMSGAWFPAAPGSAESFYWLARHFIQSMQRHGLCLDRQSLEYLAELLKRA